MCKEVDDVVVKETPALVDQKSELVDWLVNSGGYPRQVAVEAAEASLEGGAYDWARAVMFAYEAVA